MTGVPIRPFADAEARRAIREDLDRTLVVEAAAGTGKTTELVARILAVVRSGRGTLDRTIAVTFTDKAAGEMKLRLRAELENARAAARAEGDDAGLSRLEQALVSLELAHVGTIHSVCADLLREHPVEAEIDPSFEMASETQAEVLLDRAFGEWFERVLADPPRVVQRVLRARAWQSWRGEGPRAILRRAAGDLVEHRDFRAPWSRPAADYVAGMQALVDEAEAVGAMCEGHDDEDDYGFKAIAMIRDFAAMVRSRERLREESDEAFEDWLEAGLREFAKKSGKHWSWTGYRNKPLGGHDRRDVLARRDALQNAIDTWRSDAEAHLAAGLFEVLQPVLPAYEEHKRRAGVLDFVDLLLCTRNMLREDPAVRADLQARFDHLYVDEFQDTDPLQAEILTLLAASDPSHDDWRDAPLFPGKLFVVGDPKQAIYRFRRADLAVYDRVKSGLVAAGAEVVHLRTSFRATPPLQAFVDGTLGPRMGEGVPGIQATYVPFAPHRPAFEDQPAIVALPVPEPYAEWGRLGSWTISASTPPAVAAFVSWLLNESGWTVDAGDVRRAIRASDVCLLFTRMRSGRDSIAGDYARALEARAIPHVLLGGHTFFDREEIMALRHGLAAVEWPDDRLRTYATLRGPLFALSDAQLFEWIGTHGPLDPFARVDVESPSLQEVARSLAVLAELHVLRNRRPIADTVTALLDATRAQAVFAMRPSGLQSLANVMRLVDHARRIDSEGALSFRAFVEWLDHQAEERGGHEAPIVEEGADGVRLMTVHKAKGLEFPVVVLCDPMTPVHYDRPSRHVDADAGLWAMSLAGAVPEELRVRAEEVLAADEAEGLRKLYVAATRARDLLVIPAVGDMVDGRPEGWLSPLDALLYPPEPGPGEPAPGCPPFGDDTVVHRPDKARGNHRFRVGPGRHGGVVWWDPKLLDLDVRTTEGVRHRELLRPGTDAAARSASAEQAWSTERTALRARASEPSVRARTVTRASKIEPLAGLGISVVSTTAERVGRPRGARFGTLVHAMLADVPYDADEATIRSYATLHGRVLGATEAEVSAAIVATGSALAHPVMRRAAASESARREVGIMHRTPDGAVVEGTADLVFLEQDAFGETQWVVVDFKTDLEFGTDETYQVQIELYVRAVEAATGATAVGLLLGV